MRGQHERHHPHLSRPPRRLHAPAPRTRHARKPFTRAPQDTRGGGAGWRGHGPYLAAAATPGTSLILCVCLFLVVYACLNFAFSLPLLIDAFLFSLGSFSLFL